MPVVRKIIYSTIILLGYILISILSLEYFSGSMLSLLFSFPISFFLGIGFGIGEFVAYLFLFVTFLLMWLLIYYLVGAIMSERTSLHLKKRKAKKGQLIKQKAPMTKASK